MKRLIAISSAGMLAVISLGTAACGSGDEPAATPDVAAEPATDVVAQCLALAAKEEWNAALTPCTDASKLQPDDLRIKHAIAQARAAAGM